MVHLQNAHAADAAVVGAVGLVLVAPFTAAIASQALRFLATVRLLFIACLLRPLSFLPNEMTIFSRRGVRDCAWVLKHAPKIAHQNHQRQGIENHQATHSISECFWILEVGYAMKADV
jgi:hypothetical protein